MQRGDETILFGVWYLFLKWRFSGLDQAADVRSAFYLVVLFLSLSGAGGWSLSVQREGNFQLISLWTARCSMQGDSLVENSQGRNYGQSLWLSFQLVHFGHWVWLKCCEQDIFSYSHWNTKEYKNGCLPGLISSPCMMICLSSSWGWCLFWGISVAFWRWEKKLSFTVR